MEKNNESKNCEQNKNIDDLCCHNECGNKFRWAFFSIFLVLIAATVEHFFNKHNYDQLSEGSKIETMNAIEKSQRTYVSQLEDLRQEILSLKDEVSLLKKIPLKGSINNYIDENIRRKKWKIWINLKEKIEVGEDFNQELRDFYSEFCEDDELIRLVDKLLDSADVISRSNKEKKDNEFVDICKKYIKKIIRVKKVDYKQLLNISGYVLSSIENGKHGN